MKKITMSIVLALGVLVWMTSCEKSTESFYEGSEAHVKVELQDEGLTLKSMEGVDDDDPAMETADIQERILDENNNPIANAEILLYRTSDNSLIAQTTTDSEGWFSFNDLPKTNYTVVVKIDGVIVYTFSVTA
jgi:hypothetical protein